MSEVGKWDDLAGIEQAGTKLVVLPATSEALGREFAVRIRKIGPMDFAKAINFPIDEINRLMEQAETSEDWTGELQAHAKTMDAEDLFKTVDAMLMVGIVEPEPTKEALAKIAPDKFFLFSEISQFTISNKDAAEAAGFPADGEQSGT